MTDYAKLAAEAGGVAEKKDYAALAKEHGGNVSTERKAIEKDAANRGVTAYRGTPLEFEVPGTAKINQFLISTGRGFVDLWAGANQLVRSGEDAKRYTAEQQEDLNRFKTVEEEAPITSAIGRATGQTAPFLAVPGGKIAEGAHMLSKAPALGFLSKAGLGTEAATLGGLQGMMNFTPEGESRGVNAVAGAATAGGVTKGLEFIGRTMAEPVRRAASWITSKADEAVGKPGLAEVAGTRAGTSTTEISEALSKEGIDWATLPQQVRDGIKTQADEAVKAGAPLSSAEIARVVRAQNLPGGRAELTKGQMTQNRSQLRDEFNLRRTRAGESLDEQLVAQDKVLADSLDVIKLKTGGTTTAGRDAEAGQKITKPLLEQLKGAQGKVDQLYKVADEAGETLNKVDPTPLIRWVEDNYAAQHSAPAMKSLVADLKKSGIVTFTDDGVAQAGREPTIREMESLRQAMVKWGKADGASGSYMGEAKRVIDGLTDGKGGELYGKARAARIALREQFEDPQIINRLVAEKPGGDRVTAFEDVFKRSVISSSVDDLANLRKQLLLGGEGEEGKRAGIQAYKDLRAATLDYIKLSAINNAKDEFSYAGLKRAVDTIGREKLEVLFGKNTANDLTAVVESAKDMKAVFNKAGVYNPGTASALVDWIDKITGIVGLGQAGTYGRLFVSGGARKVVETLNEPRLVEQATKPVQSAIRAGAEAKADLYREVVGLYAGKVGAKAAPAAAAAVISAKPEDEER